MPQLHEYSEQLARGIRRAFNDQKVRIEIERALQPLFEDALSHTSITAWVCANDDMAAQALRFLTDRGIAVPEQISIVGFDDDIAHGFLNQLTTFNFNMQAGVPPMVDFILHPSSAARIGNGPSSEIEGYLIERQSSGPAPA
jgi:DNA-binding LacI/PurR family transcriptional regulator